MGRQWLQKKREINAAKRGKVATKLVREITVAAKTGAPDPAMNPRLALAVEAARKQSVSNDTIARAIKKGGGLVGEQVDLRGRDFRGHWPVQRAGDRRVPHRESQSHQRPRSGRCSRTRSSAAR